MSCEGDLLVFCIYAGFYSEGDDAAGCAVSDVDVAQDGEFWLVDYGDEELLIFVEIGFVHRLSDQHAGDYVKYAIVF